MRLKWMEVCMAKKKKNTTYLGVSTQSPAGGKPIHSFQQKMATHDRGWNMSNEGAKASGLCFAFQIHRIMPRWHHKVAYNATEHPPRPQQWCRKLWQLGKLKEVVVWAHVRRKEQAKRVKRVTSKYKSEAAAKAWEEAQKVYALQLVSNAWRTPPASCKQGVGGKKALESEAQKVCTLHCGQKQLG